MASVEIFLFVLISQALSLPQVLGPVQTPSSSTHVLPNTLSQITQAPSAHDLRARQAGNTCGFYNDLPITCDSLLPCIYDSYYNVKYCSPTGQLPITTIFDYDYWPIGGCLLGQACWYVFYFFFHNHQRRDLTTTFQS